MKKIISKKTYNTDTAEELGVIYSGEFGDSDGFEERLFKTKKGDNFLYGAGGVDSKFSTPTITPLTEKQAKEWLKANNIK